MSNHNLADFLKALDRFQLASEDYLKDYFAGVGWTKEILEKRETLREAKNALICMYSDLANKNNFPLMPIPRPTNPNWIPQTAPSFPDMLRTYSGNGPIKVMDQNGKEVI